MRGRTERRREERGKEGISFKGLNDLRDREGSRGVVRKGF